MNLGETIVYSGLDGLFLMKEHPSVGCVSPVFWCEACFCYGCLPCLSSECAGPYPLDKGCDWCSDAQSLHWMFGGAFSWLSQPCQGRICFPVVGVETLRVTFYKALLPLSVCCIHMEVSTEGSEACVVTAGLSATHTPIHSSAQKHCKVASFLCFVHPRPSARLSLATRVL